MARDRDADGEELITIRRSDGWFVARHEASSIASQGETRGEALANLADAIDLYQEPVQEEDDAAEPATAPWF